MIPFRLRAALVSATVLSLGCGSDPVTPPPPLEVVIAGGDGQYGSAGDALSDPLEALVRRADTGTHQQDVEVEWTVQSGDATLSSIRTSTDQDGLARITVQLGAGTDTVRIQVAVVTQPTASVVFTEYVAVAPSITGLSAATAAPGASITLSGGPFSQDPVQNVVLFSGIRGMVTSASPAELVVQVPPCLASGEVAVTAQLGSLVSDPVPLQVETGGTLTQLQPGESVDVDEADGIGCVRLPGDGSRYLVSVLSAGTVGAARYGFALHGLSDGAVAAPPGAAVPSAPPTGAFGDRWEAALRRKEALAVRDASTGAALAPAAPAGVVSVPSVGNRRTFKVLNSSGGFDEVTASARVVSQQAAIYVDDLAPAGGYTDTDLEDFARSFDDFIYPTDTGNYGQVSDLDSNGRVVILFTPAVNKLTPRGSDGFVGGFFYGVDLLDREGNHAEVFYAIVPDSAGLYSDPRQKSRILQVVPAILAHEFQHMIHFNERVLKLGASGTEALWLSEGMAQMAEELVAQAYDKAGDAVTAQRYRGGAESRAQLYLADPGAVSLIVATGQGSLAERGAGWLFTLYLWDQDPMGNILARLTQSTRTGVDNVAWATGRVWPALFSDWADAIYLDDTGVGPSELSYPSVDLKGRLSQNDGSYPLVPEALPAAGFDRTGLLWSSSVRHYIVDPPLSGSLALRLGGEAGGNAPKDAALHLRVVRIH